MLIDDVQTHAALSPADIAAQVEALVVTRDVASTALAARSVSAGVTAYHARRRVINPLILLVRGLMAIGAEHCRATVYPLVMTSMMLGIMLLL